MATVYIAPTAQGSANGTSPTNAYAFTSVASAETDATSGGTIVFVDGTYTLTNHLNLATAITYGVTYQPQTAGGVTITGAFGVRVGNTSLAAGIVINDLTFNIGSQSQSSGYQFRFINTTGGSTTMNRCNGSVDRSSGVHANCFGDNVAHNETGSKLDLFMNECDFQINMPSLSNDYETGMIGGGSNQDGASKPKNFTITSCTFFSNATGKMAFSNYNNAGGTDAVGTVVVKNTIINHEGTASKLAEGTPAVTTSFTNCSIYNGYITTGVDTLSGNIDLNPLFVDSANGDFRLRPSSPCINAGTTA